MKKLLFLLTTVIAFACQPNKDENYFVIEGNANSDLVDVTIELHEVKNGTTQLIALSKINENRDFSFRVPAIKSGLYTMHLKYKSEEMGEREYHCTERKHWRFYLGKGDFIKLKIAKNNYQLLEGNLENDYLTQWNFMADSLFQLSWKDMPTYKEYFPLMEKFVPECKAIKPKLQTSNKEFNKLLNMLIDVDMDDLPLNFLFSGNTIHPTVADYTPHLKSILTKEKLTDTFVLNHPRGLRFVESYGQFGVQMNDTITDLPSFLRLRLNYIPNDTLKGYVLARSLRYFKCYDDKYIEFMNNYKKYFVTDELKSKIETFEKSIALSGKGSVAYDFVANDINGKDYKLSDFKGKVVYIDIWATWCGPCKQEIPHLKKLEKKFKGKDIAFIKLSFDDNKKAWEDWVKEKKPAGNSFHMPGAFKSELAKLYQIGAIPRFILIDKKGNIVSTDALRPSDPSIEKVINALL